MTIIPFDRLTSNTTEVFLGADRAQAAFNAANSIGVSPDAVARYATWSSLKKFDNDTTSQPFSPFGAVTNPEYIWNQPTSDGQTAAFAIASNEFIAESDFSVFLGAFADNAMEAKIELFISSGPGNPFTKASPQPDGLDEFLLIAGEPNNPAVGLTINNPPFTFQDIRMFSTVFTSPIPVLDSSFKIVVSFEGTNYLIQPQYASNPSSLNNPAGLQFIVDIYRNALD